MNELVSKPAAPAIASAAGVTAQVNTTLRAHRIAFLLECRGVTGEPCASLATVSLGEVAPYGGSLAWLDPDRIEPGDPRPLQRQPVWEQKELAVSEDLHPSVHAILSSMPGHKETAKPMVLRLSDHARNLLAGRYRPAPASGGPHRGWTGPVLALGHAAVDRLGVNPLTLQLHIEDVSFLAFRTGFGIVLIEATLIAENRAPLTPEVLVEAVHLCGDEQRAASLRWSGTGEGSGFHLGDLVRPLFAPTRIAVMKRRRVYSYTTVLLEGELAAAAQEELGLRVSRHYNYSYAPEMLGTEVYRPFTPVLHAMSIEGAATIVHLTPAAIENAAASPGLPPEFLTNWIENAYRRAYLPILLVLFHEYLTLLDLAQSAALDIDFHLFAEKQARKLQQLCDRFLAFRLRYRPPLVSDITMHNTFQELLRKALALEALSRKAGQDLVEAELRLSRFTAERERRAREALHSRWAWHGAVVTGALGFLVVNGIARQIAELSEQMLGTHGGLSSYIIEISGLVLALIVGAAGALFGWRRLRHGVGDGVHEEESDDAHVAHTAL